MGTEPIIAHPAGISKAIFAISLVVVAIVAGVGGYYGYAYSHPTNTSTTTGPPNETLNGAGATFPYPFLSAVITNYTKSNSNIQVNYNPVGSGAGVTDLSQKLVDFAASDYPLSNTDRGNAPNALEIPETIGAVTVAYNLGSSFPTGLKLDAITIAKIMQGNITMWNDPVIVNLNPSANLPAHAIQTVHRSDGSGTTFIFTTWLNSTATGVWKLKAGKTVTWPVGLAEPGNQGVAGTIQQNQYSVGYVELAYALTNKMTVSYVQNPAMTFVQPTLGNVTYAVTNATASQTLPAGNQSWTGVSLLNAPGINSYPIVSFTYLMVYKELNVNSGYDQNKATAVANFLWFVVHGGQAQAASLGYVALPQSVVAIDETTIRSVTFNGTVLHS